MNEIKVSVIMPVYNSGGYLKTAVDSILNQSLREIELILVDDGSTDGSSEKCDEYAKFDKRVVVIHQKNGGICNARNTALMVARGEYIGWSDHDDEYLPGYLFHAYAEAKINNADVVKVGKKDFILHGSTCVRTKICCLDAHVYSQHEIKNDFFRLIDSNQFECLWDGLFKRSLLNDNDLKLDESFQSGGEDIDFNLRVLPLATKIITIDTVYYYHYIRKGFSTSSKYNTNSLYAKRTIAIRLQETMRKLNINTDVYQFEYTYQLLRQYIAPVCRFYSLRNCPLKYKDKVSKLKDIKKESFYYDFCNHQSWVNAYRISKKYGMLYFLFKYEFFWLIFFMYNKRESKS